MQFTDFVLFICCLTFILIFILAESFGVKLHNWYIEFGAWNFAVFDYAVTGGADRFILAMGDAPSVSRMYCLTACSVYCL